MPKENKMLRRKLLLTASFLCLLGGCAYQPRQKIPASPDEIMRYIKVDRDEFSKEVKVVTPFFGRNLPEGRIDIELLGVKHKDGSELLSMVIKIDYTDWQWWKAHKAILSNGEELYLDQTGHDVAYCYKSKCKRLEVVGVVLPPTAFRNPNDITFKLCFYGYKDQVFTLPPNFVTAFMRKAKEEGFTFKEKPTTKKK